MKTYYLLLFTVFLFFTKANAQDHNDVLDYDLNGTPVYGVKIKTALPFTAGYEMPTITIQGFNYDSNQTIGLQIVFYISCSTSCTTVNSSTGSPYYKAASISSFGGYTPQVYLGSEAGNVVIFINDKSYYQRFTVSAYAKGLSGDNPANFTGWAFADEAFSPSPTGTSILLPYTNSFMGNVNMPGTGIWNTAGNVGIGTVNPGAFKLAVKGNIHAQEFNLDLTGWSDYVFKNDYRLPPLTEVKTYIDQNHHLADIPSEQQIVRDGLNLGEMDKLLVKKVEELTLYLIEKDKQINVQQQQMNLMKQQMEAIEKQLNKK